MEKAADIEGNNTPITAEQSGNWNNVQCCVCGNNTPTSHYCSTCDRPNHEVCGYVHKDQDGSDHNTCNPCLHEENIAIEWKRSHEGQVKGARICSMI